MSAPDRIPELPRRAPFRGLASKIILFVSASTIVTASAVSWISIASAHSSLRGTLERLYPLATEHTARRLETWLGALRDELKAAPRAARAGRGEAPSRLPEGVTGLATAAALAAGGGARALEGEVPHALARRALRAGHGLAFGRTRDGGALLAVAVPHPDDDGDGAVVGVVPQARLVPLLEAALPSESAAIALTDAEGRILALGGSPSATGGAERLDPSALRGGEPLRELELGGTRVVGASRPLGGSDWHVAIVAPVAAAYGPVLAVATRVLLTALCIILLVSLVAYRALARAVRPVEALSEAARRVARGETDLEIPDAERRDEIGLLTRTFNDMIRELRRQREQIETTHRHLTDQNARLQQANEVLSQLSITDGLTKLHNHRFFQDFLTREIKRVSRTDEPLAMLLLDIDDFKRLNDHVGHAAGDEILTRIAQILNDAVRESDLCARYGGEEFVVLAPDTDAAGAERLAQKIRSEIAESSFIVDESLRPLRITVSVGVARFDGERKSFFRKADQALYRAKAEGKDCVVVHEEDEEA